MAMVAPFRFPLFAAATATTASSVMSCAGYTNLVLYLSSVGTTSGGVVTVEEADYPDEPSQRYGGTWSSITTINASDFTGGAQKAYHFPADNAYAYVRVRISDAITGGGSISAVLRGQ